MALRSVHGSILHICYLASSGLSRFQLLRHLSSQPLPPRDEAHIYDEAPGFSGRSEGEDFADAQSEAVRMRLLDAAMPHVKAHGWTHSALVAAAMDLKLSPAVTGILRRREAELVEHVIRRGNADLSARLRAGQAEGGGSGGGAADLHQRLRHALKMRLELVEPHIDQWPQVCTLGIYYHSFHLAIAVTPYADRALLSCE